MKNTTRSNTIQVGFFGETNSAKSTLFNTLLEQEFSITSEVKGTTTDIVTKNMEILGKGIVTLIDTAGLKDESSLGKKREEKTKKAMERVDLAIFCIAKDSENLDSLEEFVKLSKDYKFTLIPLITKSDTKEKVVNLKEEIRDLLDYQYEIFELSREEKSSRDILIDLMSTFKDSSEKDINISLLGGVIKPKDTIIFVMPIDSEAPKGRLILPQVQALRDALDNKFISIVVQVSELKDVIDRYKKDISLVVTDSQAFKVVDEIVPKDIFLTSFSILLARLKGDVDEFVKGARAVSSLTKNSKIVMLESCTHNISHEDIGKVKIPKLLEKRLGFKPDITHFMGDDFPKDIEKYSLIIHCGGCMINKIVVQNRIEKSKKIDISITNYGILIAHLTGIMDRSVEVFKR